MLCNELCWLERACMYTVKPVYTELDQLASLTLDDLMRNSTLMYLPNFARHCKFCM